MTDSYHLVNTDCVSGVAELPENSVDSFVTDPPYGLAFMGKEWDHGVPGVSFWSAFLRVAKPGAHLLAFGGTRTYHRLTCAIEDAGWEIRDCLMWVYGSGFPKSLNLDGDMKGWGTALKPAWEPIIMARKPIDGTVAKNVAEFGVGVLNIDGCRVGCDGATKRSGQSDYPRNADGTEDRSGSWARVGHDVVSLNAGRWPANLIHDGSDEVLQCFPSAPGQQRQVGPEFGDKSSINTFGDYGPRQTFEPRGDSGSAARFFYCAKASKADRDEGCDGLSEKFNRGSGTHANGQANTRLGNAAERAQGITHVELAKVRNNHPTVKPTDLMRYLCRLITPRGGLICDPFMGSGSTGKAARMEGFRFIGFEKDTENGYFQIAESRIKQATSETPLFD